MTGVSEILAELEGRGIRFEFRPHGGVRLVPARLIDQPLPDSIRAHKTELLARLHAGQKKEELDRPARADGSKPLPPTGAPAYSIITTCQHHGVALSLDEAGDLMIGRADGRTDELIHQWPSLFMAIEAHLEDVASLVKVGWTLKAAFPKAERTNA
jgi:hypothetical protein